MLNKFRFFKNFQIIILFVLLLFTFHSQLLARAGDLDTTFDGDGILTREFDGSLNSAPQSAAAIQPDGKIIFASTGWIFFPTGSNDGYTVIRYNPNGSIDTTFGTNGIVNTNVGNFEGLVNILLQPDGKIILSGERYNGNTRTDFALLRYHPDGTLDNSFDGNGLAVATFTNFSEERWGAAALQPDGKIVVAGQTDNETENTSFDWAVVRFNTDGSLDTTFDGDGRTSFSLGGDTELAASVAIQQDGKIVVSGTSSNGSNNDFTTVRLNSNGSRDQGFGANGLVRTQFGNGNESAYSVKIQNDNKIVVAGSAYNGTNNDIALVRYNTDGSPDPNFGTNGLVTASFTQTSGEGTYSLVIQPDGKLVVSSSFGANAGVFRFNGDGTLDNAFGNGGKVSNAIRNSTNPIAYSTAIQNDGKIVIAGAAYWQSSSGPSYYFLARYHGASTNKSPYDFDGDGKTDIGIFRPSVGEWWINRSSSGQTTAAQFGATGDKPVPADFTGDGKSDVAFFRPSSGEWFILRSEDSSFLSFTFGTSGDVPVAADFDGDGKADVGVFRPSTNEWFIQKSSGGVLITTFGVTGDVPVVADYDGDGKADIAIYRPGSGQWWIQRSSNLSVVAAAFGTASDKPVQGDYSGDGKADIAFYRPSTGEWFILRSEDGSFYSVPFGAAGDIPSPGDYDGDGKFDTAVFRPSGATWFVNRTSAGILITNFGVTGDRPIPGSFVP